MSDEKMSIEQIHAQIEKHEQRCIEDEKQGKPRLRFIDYISPPSMDEMSAPDPKFFDEIKKLTKDMGVNLKVPTGFSVIDERAGFKPGELRIIASGEHTGRSTLFTRLIERMATDKSFNVVFADLEWSPMVHVQGENRMLRQPTSKASRRYREGHFIGRRKGKVYRSKVSYYGYPQVSWGQVERVIWERAMRKEMREHDTERKEKAVPQGECCLHEHGHDADVGQGIRPTGEGDPRS